MEDVHIKVSQQITIPICVILFVSLPSCIFQPKTLEPSSHLLELPQCNATEEQWWHIFEYNVTTGEHTQLTEGQVHDSAPVFSPDGENVAFIRDYASIEILDLRTHTRKTILEHEGIRSDLRWSPDGEQFAFVADWTHGTPQIYTIKVDGTNATRLTQENFEETCPYWLPDSRQLAFISHSSKISGAMAIYTTTVGSESAIPTEILSRPCTSQVCNAFYSMAWSPNDEMIAVATHSSQLGFLAAPAGWPRIVKEREGVGIVVFGQDAPATILWTELGGFKSLAWSPDGSQILYYSGCACGEEHIGVVKVATQENRRLFGVPIDTGHMIADPSWSPDSKAIVYTQASCIP